MCQAQGVDAAIQHIKAKRGEDDLMADVGSLEGRPLAPEYPDDIAVPKIFRISLPSSIRNKPCQGPADRAVALGVQPSRRMHGMYSALDGSVQPMKWCSGKLRCRQAGAVVCVVAWARPAYDRIQFPFRYAIS
jgi:hypothetical protein